MEGNFDGIPEGIVEGFNDGCEDGIVDGLKDGIILRDGSADGKVEGREDGFELDVGFPEGWFDDVGCIVGAGEGRLDGVLVGTRVGLGVMTMLIMVGLLGSILYKNANSDAGIATNGFPNEYSVARKSTAITSKRLKLILTLTSCKKRSCPNISCGFLFCLLI